MVKLNNKLLAVAFYVLLSSSSAQAAGINLGKIPPLSGMSARTCFTLSKICFVGAGVSMVFSFACQVAAQIAFYKSRKAFARAESLRQNYSAGVTDQGSSVQS